MSSKVTLRTYFRPAGEESPDPLGPAAYVAGFEDQEGEPWGVSVPLGSEDVEPMIVTHAGFYISMQLDGNLLIEADALCDAAIEQIAKQDPPTRSTINQMVRETLRPERLAMEDNPVAELQKLRDRLKDALGLVEETLRNLD